MTTISKTLGKLFRPYVGDVALKPPPERHLEREIICLVARLQNLESLICQQNLREVGSLINRYYCLIANAVKQSRGDIDRFCGRDVIAYYSGESEEAALAAIEAALRTARDSLEPELGLRIGFGICSGPVIYGRFGTSDRCTVTAFGSPVVCADRLADEEHTLAVCELITTRTPNMPLTSDPWVSVHPHWNPSRKG